MVAKIQKKNQDRKHAPKINLMSMKIKLTVLKVNEYTEKHENL